MEIRFLFYLLLLFDLNNYFSFCISGEKRIHLILASLLHGHIVAFFPIPAFLSVVGSLCDLCSSIMGSALLCFSQNNLQTPFLNVSAKQKPSSLLSHCIFVVRPSIFMDTIRCSWENLSTLKAFRGPYFSHFNLFHVLM